MNHPLLPDHFDFNSLLPLWLADQERKKITRKFTFTNFEQAFEFMTLAAQYAQEIDHHPDWSNSWNKVEVELSTHSSNGLTALDAQMAQAMDLFALQVQASKAS